MAEQDAVYQVDSPRTRRSLADDLGRLGVTAGGTLLVHSSLSSLGWVCGGPAAVVHALLDVLGPAGALVVPTQTGDNSDPALWRRPPVPEAWWPVIRANTPATFGGTPSRGMGKIAETVRCWPGARRSTHPQTSFAAVGAGAEQILEPHPLDCQLGENSPLARLYDRDAGVLLLGVDHAANTSLHLAEYRRPDPPQAVIGCAIETHGKHRWVTYTDVDLDESDFARLGEDFDATGKTTTGTVGSAVARLFRQRDAVDFATGWLARHR
ncbi:MAG: AAC(3) family N-acetyltransferase [Actinomycetota bacterium]|nr:AAC(3) family N-acetyltransferase [Actinomycetota bacterium]